MQMSAGTNLEHLWHSKASSLKQLPGLANEGYSLVQPFLWVIMKIWCAQQAQQAQQAQLKRCVHFSDAVHQVQRQVWKQPWNQELY